MKLADVNQKIKNSELTQDRKDLLHELAWLLVNKEKIEDIVFNREHEVPFDVIEVLKANINELRIDALYQELTLIELELLH